MPVFSCSYNFPSPLDILASPSESIAPSIPITYSKCLQIVSVQPQPLTEIS